MLAAQLLPWLVFAAAALIIGAAVIGLWRGRRSDASGDGGADGPVWRSNHATDDADAGGGDD